ncbi:MAG TPA: flagellar hook-length control protein FliK [Bosea sp. (in: a-proteobacteria)]
MSIQPLSNSSPTAEPASQRRRAAERDAGGERESFVLPREKAASEAAAPVRERSRETARDTRETRRAADEPATQAERSADAAAEPATEQAASEIDANAPASETAKPAGKPAPNTAGTAAEPAPVAQPAAPNPDIGALVSIAVAEQAESQPAKPGKDAGTAGEAPEEKKAEGEAGAAMAEPKTGDVAVVVTPSAQAVAFVQPGPVPTLPVEPAAPAAGAAGEGDLSSSTAKAATAAAALALTSTLETMPGAASDAAAPVSAMTAGIPPAAPKHGSMSEAPPPSIDGDQMAVPEGTQSGGEKTALAQAQTQAPATAQASAPADFKPVEALQQALSQVDLSAMGQQGVARPDPLRILTTPEQIAAQAPVAAPGHQVSEGQPTPLHVLPIEIGLRALAGARQFDIRLDPGELGRVDVNLSISDTGEVSAKMVVDRVETLHLLQRDARTLERAFEQAGLKPSDAGVDITLRDPSDQSGFRQNRPQDEAPQRARVFANGSEVADDQPISTQSAPVRRFVRLGGVDMSV